MLWATLVGIAAVDHPNFEVVVVVGHDDPATHAAAMEAAAELAVPIKVVVDHHLVKNKPKALNVGLPHCGGDIVMVIDAEDDVQPGLPKHRHGGDATSSQLGPGERTAGITAWAWLTDAWDRAPLSR